MKRKTANLQTLKDWANAFLAHPNNSPENKEGVCCMLESALHSANAYAGFQYVHWEQTGCKDWEQDGKPEPTPDTYLYGTLGRFARRYY